ncbi:MAG: hypothetical protein KIT47_00475 [Rhodoferax sp.]|nr:hypothetical protein [Rhodoferax sp.]
MTDTKVREAGSWIFSLIGKVVLLSIKATFVLVLGLVAWGLYLSWDVDRWDAKIDALCAANGGKDVAIKLYQTVKAPETEAYFRNLGALTSFYIPERLDGRSFGPAYPYVIETRVVEVLHKRNPSVVRFESKVLRVEDGKVLAERSGYQRAGGGVPGIDPGEIHVCPRITTNDRLDVQVFVNHPEHVSRRGK